MVKSISAQSLDISRRAWQWFLLEDDTTVRSSAYALALERQEDTSSSDGRNHFPLPQLGFHPPDLIQVDSLSGFVLVVMKWGQSVHLDGGNLCEIPSFAVSRVIFLPECINVGVCWGKVKRVVTWKSHAKSKHWEWLCCLDDRVEGNEKD